MKTTTLPTYRIALAAALVASAGTALAGGGLDEEIRAGARAFAVHDCGADECAEAHLAAPAWRAPPKGPVAFDEATGRRLANYPPHVPADFTHMKLDLSIDDMDRRVMTGVETLTFAPLGWPLEELLLDARAMKISRVESPGRKATFTHDGRSLRVRLDPPPAPGERSSLVIRYSVSEPTAGLMWTTGSKAWPGRSPQLHTQGEPQSNSYWFPCHDFPNDRLTTEVRVTVPAGYDVCSNGRLAARERGVRGVTNRLGGSDMAPVETFHWVQDERAGGDHVPYLVSMVVGKFDVVDVGSQSLPMPVYAPRGRGADVPGTFGRTPQMAEALAGRFDEPYPWAKYAQCVVWNFGAGGMENTGATTLYDTVVIARDALADFDQDGLISHELGHQWFGDLVTCRSWEHIWLNEGFATYASALWSEARPGPRAGHDAYQASVRGNFDWIIGSDRPEAPYAQPMVSKVYDHPWETFRRPANPYGKGASILHMLRVRLGDDAFFKGIAAYVDRFKHGTVETADLRKTLEEVSGESLEQFFDQWCMRPGVPTLKVDTSYEAATSTLKVDVEQTQNIDSDNPPFAFSLPVWVSAGGAGKWLNIDVQDKKASGSVTLTGEPAMVVVDPDMAVLAGLRIAQPVQRWINQLAGPTYNARVQAARALGAMGDKAGKDAAGALFALAMDRREDVGMRAEAVRALGAMRDVPGVETLAVAQLTPTQVRESAVEALWRLAATREDTDWSTFRRRAVSVLADLGERDPSVRTRAEAVTGLGKLKAREKLPVVLAASKTDSQDDVVRQAALGALADMGAADKLPSVLEFTQDGWLSRTRAKATESLGLLGAKSPDQAVARVGELLNDREVRVRGAARQALVDLGDPRGVALLEKAAESPGDADAADARACLKRLKAGQEARSGGSN